MCTKKNLHDTAFRYLASIISRHIHLQYQYGRTEVITLADVMREIGGLGRELRNLNNDVLSNGRQLADLDVLISEVLKSTEKTQGE